MLSAVLLEVFPFAFKSPFGAFVEFREIGLPSWLTLPLVVTIVENFPQVAFALLWPGCWGNYFRESEYGPDFISNEDYERFTFAAVDAVTEMRIQDQGATPTLQGLFWLDVSQSHQAELFSFAETPEGGGLSPGFISATEPLSVRGPGDRVSLSATFVCVPR